MYTTEKKTLENTSQSDIDFIAWSANRVQKLYGTNYEWGSFKILLFIRDQHFWICYRNGEPVGFMAASIYKNFFDSKTVTLKQNLLFSLPNTRAAYLLLKDFIDFGRVHANHILTAIGKETNIKAESLKKLGFNKLEELYRMEIS